MRIPTTSAAPARANTEQGAATDRSADLQARLRAVEALIAGRRPAKGLAQALALTADHPVAPDAYRAAAAACDALNDPRADAFRHVAEALITAAADAPADVWDGVVPTEPADHAQSEDPAPPPTDDPPALPDVSAAPDPVAEPQPLAFDADRLERPALTLNAIIGADALKERIDAVVLAPARATRTRQLGGVLMFGPPGCGKSFFARTIAGELGAGFRAIDMGAAAAGPGDPRDAIQRLFAAARAAAPCVLFLDDIDRAGVRPDAQEAAPDRRVIGRLAAELAGMTANCGVTVLAGSTSPWDVDVALHTSGALARSLLVAPPDAAARAAILRHRFRDVPLAGVEISWIVDRTQHFSGDDLLTLCEHAVRLAEDDPMGPPTVGPGHMTRALREVRASAPGWFSAAIEHGAAARHGGMYDLTLAYIEQNDLV